MEVTYLNTIIWQSFIIDHFLFADKRITNHFTRSKLKMIVLLKPQIDYQSQKTVIYVHIHYILMTWFIFVIEYANIVHERLIVYSRIGYIQHYKSKGSKNTPPLPVISLITINRRGENITLFTIMEALHEVHLSSKRLL